MDPVIIDAPSDIGDNILRRKCRRAREKGRPVRLVKRYRRAGWKAALPLYVLWCGQCELHTVAHPAGYGRISCKNRGCAYRARVSTPARRRDKLWRPIFYELPGRLLLPATLALLILVVWKC